MTDRARWWASRLRYTAVAIVCALLLVPPVAQAATKVVNFDSLAAGTVVTDQYKDPGDGGVFFSSEDGLLPVIRSATGLAHSGSQVGDISVCGGCEFFTPNTLGRFVESPTEVSAYVGFWEQAAELDPAELTLIAEDESGQELDSATATVAKGEPFLQQLSVSSTTPIASFRLTTFPADNNQPVGFDDLTMTYPETPAPPGFSLGVSGEPASIPQGDSVEVPISVNRLNGSNGDIALSASGLPAGVTASFSPSPVAGTESSTTMKLTAGPTAAPSGYTQVTIAATPSPGAGAAPRTVTKLVRVIENCVREFRADFLDVRSDDCMRTAGPGVLVATDQTVRVDGLALTPRTGTQRLVINKQKRTISSPLTDQIEVSLADHPAVPLYLGNIDWDLGTPGSGAKKVFDYMGKEVILLAKLPVQKVSVSLTKKGQAQITPTFKLAFWPFNYLGAISATTGFTADNDHGTDFTGLEIKVDKVEALGISLKDLSIKWREGGTWSGSGTITLRFASPYSLTAGIGLKEGDLDFLKGAVGNLNVAVSPGVFLQSIGFGLERSPFALSGTVGFSGGPSVAGKTAVSVNGTFKATLDDPLVFEVNGNAKLAETFTLGEVFMRYASTGLFELGGKLHWDLGVAYADGQVSGFVDGFDAADLEGTVHACIPVSWAPDPCAGASFLVSNIGIAACIDLYLGSAGVGYEWGGDFDLFWGSCDLGPWRPAKSSGSARISATGRYVLRKGLPSAAFAVDGVGGAPNLTLTGPHHESISVTSSQHEARVGKLFAAQAGDTTYLVVKKPAPGAWTLTDDGLFPIQRVRQAFGLPRPSAHATVSGSGRARTLRWRLRPIAGQRVTFVEEGRDVRSVIASTAASAGSTRFQPADGAAGKRKIIALVTQNGLPRASLDAGSYRAPATLRPARPRRVRIARRGSRLVVSWEAPRPGFRHAVYLRRSDDVRVLQEAAAGRKAVTFAATPRGYGATVTITGLSDGNRKGPPARASIKGVPPKRPASGNWKLSSAFGYVKNGAFTVTRRGAVTGFRLSPGSAAACGAHRLQKVAGALRPKVVSRLGLATWAVRRGSLTLDFDGPRRGDGELKLKGCRIPFEAQR